jgi:SAM-dependent methyltransferase
MMAVDPPMKTFHELSVSVEALAALGAALRQQRSGAEADPRVRVCLHDVLHAIDPPLVVCLGNKADYAGPLIETVFRQPTDLLHTPERGPGWRRQDPLILQSQGQVSRLIAYYIDEPAVERSNSRAILRGSGAFLDVGTGAGWLALEAARIWPKLRIVDIDVWEPALALVRDNATASEFGKRVELRSQAVEHFDEPETCALFPGSFILAELTHAALERIYHALPGGWQIFALWAQSANPLAAAASNLHIVRSRGHPWLATEAADALLAARFVAIEAPPPGEPGFPVAFVLGQRSRLLALNELMW